jgi:hypothetical protein
MVGFPAGSEPAIAIAEATGLPSELFDRARWCLAGAAGLDQVAYMLHILAAEISMRGD